MGIGRRTWSRLALAAGIGLLALSGAGEATAQKAEDHLRIALRNAVPNIDPYYNSQRTGLVVAHQAWDTLVHRDPSTFRNVPGLAAAWRWVDETTLEFDLRPGVRFHDGSSLGPDDVVYTLNLVAHPESGVATPSNYNWIERAERTGDMQVRVHLKTPRPAAIEYFALVVPIYPKAYRERVGPEGYAREPVGTGPYRLTHVDPGARLELERFEDYYRDSPKGRPAIRRLTVRFVPDEATEMTELLAGSADWIWNINPDHFESISRMPHLQAARRESMRVGYLSIDAAGRSGAGNPLTKLKVRQAIWHAIDRQTFAERLVGRGSRVPDGPCYPDQFGCETSTAVRYAYDPARAKALLAEAGFPDGIETELVTYVLPQWAAAIQGYLDAVGIRARINQLQIAAATERSWRGQNPLYLAAWGSYSINDVSAFLPAMFGGGNEDYTRDPEVQRLVAEGGATNDEEARRRAYGAAIRRITEQAYWLPLHTYVTTYAFSRELEFQPWPDELPRFYAASWR